MGWILSKLMLFGVMENRSLSYGNSSKKEDVASPKSNNQLPQSNEQRVEGSTSSMAPTCLNSNWEKFRNVVFEQDSVRKHPKRQHPPGKSSRANRKTPRMPLPENRNPAGNDGNVSENKDDSVQEAKLTKHISMDCEMVGIGDGTESMLARVSLVNRHGICVYDKYVKPTEEVRDYRTAVSGIRPHHLIKGEDFKVVQSEVAAILKGRILIGHALRNDLNVLFLSHPKRHVRDTSRYKPFRQVAQGCTPSLKKLATQLLGIDIQRGEHNSIEDARTAMQLYVLYKAQWEMHLSS